MSRNIITASLIFISLGIAHAESFDNLAQALASPERVTSLSIREPDSNTKHLPPKLGAFVRDSNWIKDETFGDALVDDFDPLSKIRPNSVTGSVGKLVSKSNGKT